jgi:3-hydroxybutyryl-CoA dehydrogenase
MSEIKVVGIIGAGAMGSGIAQVAALAGHQVIIVDAYKDALNKAKENILRTLRKQVEKGAFTQQKSDSISANISFTDDINSLNNCGLIIEAIIENLDVKQKLFSDLEKIVSDDCILATNTSSLSIVSIASACNKPERVIGIHFFNPAQIMPLVEIIPGLTTDENISIITKNLIDSWGKKTVLAKDTPGFIVNRIARPFYGEAIRIYEEGEYSFATIDWAMKTIGGFKMGPFELMDFIGNDINYKVTETVFEQMFYDPRYKPSITQKRLYESKRFGKKSGRGYYDYAEGAINPQPVDDYYLGNQIFTRIIAMLINEATEALFLKIATRDDIDLAMTKGVNYPKGLLKWADELGIGHILNILEELHSDYGDDRYRPSVLLRKMHLESKLFYQSN